MKLIRRVLLFSLESSKAGLKDNFLLVCKIWCFDCTYVLVVLFRSSQLHVLHWFYPCSFLHFWWWLDVLTNIVCENIFFKFLHFSVPFSNLPFFSAHLTPLFNILHPSHSSSFPFASFASLHPLFHLILPENIFYILIHNLFYELYLLLLLFIFRWLKNLEQCVKKTKVWKKCMNILFHNTCLTNIVSHITSLTFKFGWIKAWTFSSTI